MKLKLYELSARPFCYQKYDSRQFKFRNNCCDLNSLIQVMSRPQYQKTSHWK